MSLIVAGTIRVPPENMDALRPHMATMIAATRAEDGCETYGFAEDVADPGLIHVFEVWRDQDALGAHARSPHMAAWRTAGAGLGVSDRRIAAYEVASQRQL
jgi:quinol monooxygenase YgiN